MKIIIVKNKVGINELKEIGREFFDTMIKGVVDIEKEILAFGGEYHIDANNFLLARESLRQSDIWGFNLVFGENNSYYIEYISLINIRPQIGNRSMEVQDAEICAKMERIIREKLNE